MSPLWPKWSGPSGTTRWPRTAPSQECAAGWPSRMVTRAAPRRERGEDASRCGDAPRPARAGAPRGVEPAGVQPVRAGDRQQAGAGLLGAQLGEGGLGLRRDRALVGERDRARPAAGGTTQCAPAITAAGSSVRVGLLRAARVERRSQTAEPSGFCMWSKRVAQQDRQLVDIGRLVAGEPVGGHADQRRVDATGAGRPPARA